MTIRRGQSAAIDESGLQKEYENRGKDSTSKSYYINEEVQTIKILDDQQNHWRFAMPASPDGNPVSAWAMTIHVHSGVGPDRGRVICPARTFNNPCPVCEWRDGAWDTEDFDKVKKLYPQARSIANAIDRNHPEKGIQIADMPKIGLYDEILTQCQNPETGAIINIALVQNGHDVFFMRGKVAGSPIPKYSGIKIGVTPNDISQIIEASGGCFVLPDVLIVHDYDTLADLWNPELYLKGNPKGNQPAGQASGTPPPAATAIAPGQAAQPQTQPETVAGTPHPAQIPPAENQGGQGGGAPAPITPEASPEVESLQDKLKGMNQGGAGQTGAGHGGAAPAQTGNGGGNPFGG